MNNNITISDFYCTHCGRKGISIPRKDSQRREAGHLKNLYCPFCKDTYNAVEVRPYGSYNLEDFLIEFQNNNFDENGKRKLPFRQFISEYKKKRGKKMKKYKLIDACYDEQSGESYACIQTDLGIFEGFAKLHPAEKYPSTYVGCEYAEYRAVIKALKAEKRIAKAQLKTMENYYHLISHMKGFDFKSDAASKARRTIYVFESRVEEFDRRIEALNNKLSTSMNSREGFLKKLFKRKNKG